MNIFTAIALNDEDLLNDSIATIDCVDEQGNTPLVYAIKLNRKLLALSIASHTSLYYLDRQDVKGRTALHWAILSHDERLVELLVLLGADLNVMDINRRTALYEACAQGMFKMVKVLIDNGASTSISSSSDITPLRVAYDLGHKHIVKYLSEIIREA